MFNLIIIYVRIIFVNLQRFNAMQCLNSGDGKKMTIIQLAKYLNIVNNAQGEINNLRRQLSINNTFIPQE